MTESQNHDPDQTTPHWTDRIPDFSAPRQALVIPPAARRAEDPFSIAKHIIEKVCANERADSIALEDIRNLSLPKPEIFNKGLVLASMALNYLALQALPHTVKAPPHRIVFPEGYNRTSAHRLQCLTNLETARRFIEQGDKEGVRINIGNNSYDFLYRSGNNDERKSTIHECINGVEFKHHTQFSSTCIDEAIKAIEEGKPYHFRNAMPQASMLPIHARHFDATDSGKKRAGLLHRFLKEYGRHVMRDQPVNITYTHSLAHEQSDIPPYSLVAIPANVMQTMRSELFSPSTGQSR